MAEPVANIDDLWRRMGADAEERNTGMGAINPAGLPEGCQAVWSQLCSDQAKTWQALRRSVFLEEVELKRQLFTLESQGWIRRLPGRAYLRN